MMEPGDTACSGAEGAAETLRQRGPVLDETPESERARTDEAIPTRRIFQVNTNSSWNACAFFSRLSMGYGGAELDMGARTVSLFCFNRYCDRYEKERVLWN